MFTAAEEIILEYGGIRISPALIAEMDGDRVAVKIPREEIVAVKLRRGIAAERPLLVLPIGIAMVVCGVMCLMVIVDRFTNGGKLSEFHACGAMLILFGGWLASTVVVPRHYFRVTTRGGQRKLAFRRSAAADEVMGLVERARESGMLITTSGRP